MATPKKAVEKKVITFRATIPPVAKVIDFHGDGGVRLVLDIPDSDKGGFLPMLTMLGKVLVVSIREAE